MTTPYTHAEFQEYGALRWALAETAYRTTQPDRVVLTVPVGNGTIAELVMTKKEAATLAGHLLQASDADDLTAVGDDK